MERDLRPGPTGARSDRDLRLGLWLVPGTSSRAIRRALDAVAEGTAPPAEGGWLPGFEPGGRAALADALGLRGAARSHLLAVPDLAGAAADERRRLAARGGRAILRGDPDYPPALEDLPDPPEALEVRGSLPGGRAVAVVGARDAPASARAFAREVGAMLARAGVAVVSGGALGIDAAAHRGALDGGGATLAVLGSGVLRPLPSSHRSLFAGMLEAGGGLASELPCDAAGRREHFPRRNRLIAALAEAVVVVAAAEGSGSLYTAEAARVLGRRLFACHGGAPAAGCAALIEAGAVEVASPATLAAALGLPAPAEAGAAASPEEAALLRGLGAVPRPLAALAADAGLAPAAAARSLAALCGRGLARPAGPGRFARP